MIIEIPSKTLGINSNEIRIIELGARGPQGPAGSGGGGGVTDGDKGDITVSGSGAVWTVDNGAISLLKTSAGVQASLTLADSALQSGDNISELVNDSGYLLSSTAASTYVPYTGASGSVDLGANTLAASSVLINGTNGNGHIHLKHQSSDATATGSSTVLFANSSGDLKYKNAGNFYTTFSTSANTADRVYTFPDSSGTISIGVTQYTDEMAQDAIGAMVDSSLVYNDATPLLSRAALTGEATASAGSNSVTLTNSAVIGKVLTGFTSGAGTVAATDSILQAFQKIVGNISALVTGVSSVFGRTGAVTAQSGDYNTSQVTENTNLYFTDERAQDAVGAALVDTATVDFTYNDASNQITADVKDSSLGTVKLGGDITTAGKALIDDASASAQRATLGLDIEHGSFYLNTGANITIPLISSSRYAFTINGLNNLKTSSGTITAAIQINGVNVTGLSALSVTSSAQSPNASSANTVAIGDRVTLVLSSNSSAVNIEFTLRGTR